MTWDPDGKSGEVERAFEIARSGSCAGLNELPARLKAEGHSGRQIDGPMLLRQLRQLCRSAQSAQLWPAIRIR